MKKLIIFTFADLPGYEALSFEETVLLFQEASNQPCRLYHGNDASMLLILGHVQEITKIPGECHYMFNDGMNKYFPAEPVVRKIEQAAESSDLIVLAAPTIAEKIAEYFLGKAELYCIDPAVIPGIATTKTEGAYH